MWAGELHGAVADAVHGQGGVGEGKGAAKFGANFGLVRHSVAPHYLF